MKVFLALHGSLKTGSRLRDSDCPLIFHSCDRQLLKSFFTQMGCSKRHKHFHRSSFNSLQPACTRILRTARRIVSNWGVSLRIWHHVGFPPPSLSSIVSVALAGLRGLLFADRYGCISQLTTGRRQAVTFWKHRPCQFICVRVQIVFGNNDQLGQRPLQLLQEGK